MLSLQRQIFFKLSRLKCNLLQYYYHLPHSLVKFQNGLKLEYLCQSAFFTLLRLRCNLLQYYYHFPRSLVKFQNGLKLEYVYQWAFFTLSRLRCNLLSSVASQFPEWFETRISLPMGFFHTLVFKV